MEELEDPVEVLSAEAELAQINARQAELQAQIDAAQAAIAQKIAAAKETAAAKKKNDAVQTAIAEMSAAKQRREAEAQLEADILAELTRKRLARQAEEKLELERANKERDSKLAERVALAAQEAAERKAEEKKQQALSEARAHAARLEHELRVSMATLEQEVIIAENTEEKPKTLIDGPLAIIFGKSAQVEEAGLSAEQHYSQLKSREVKEAQIAEPIRKVKAQPDYDTSHNLEVILKPLIGQVNPERADHFAAIYSPTHLLNTARILAINARGKMGCDSLWSLLGMTLEQAHEREMVEKAQLATEAEKVRIAKVEFENELSKPNVQA